MQKCKYPQHGLRSSRCPECGKIHPAPNTWKEPSRVTIAAMSLSGLILLSAAVFLFSCDPIGAAIWTMFLLPTIGAALGVLITSVTLSILGRRNEDRWVSTLLIALLAAITSVNALIIVLAW